MSSTPAESGTNTFETLTHYAWNYFHPDGYYDSIDELKRLVNQPPDKMSARIRTFIEELREAILTDGRDLPEDCLVSAAGYGDGNDHNFLRRAWIELFPTTPLPGEPTHPYDALYIILHGYYDMDFQYADPAQLKQLIARPEAEQGAYLRQFKKELREVILGANLYDDDPAFLKRQIGFRDADQQSYARRVWTELYPDEPIPTAD